MVALATCSLATLSCKETTRQLTRPENAVWFHIGSFLIQGRAVLSNHRPSTIHRVGLYCPITDPLRYTVWGCTGQSPTLYDTPCGAVLSNHRPATIHRVGLYCPITDPLRYTVCTLHCMHYWCHIIYKQLFDISSCPERSYISI